MPFHGSKLLRRVKRVIFHILRWRWNTVQQLCPYNLRNLIPKYVDWKSRIKRMAFKKPINDTHKIIFTDRSTTFCTWRKYAKLTSSMDWLIDFIILCFIWKGKIRALYLHLTFNLNTINNNTLMKTIINEMSYKYNINQNKWEYFRIYNKKKILLDKKSKVKINFTVYSPIHTTGRYPNIPLGPHLPRISAPSDAQTAPNSQWILKKGIPMTACGKFKRLSILLAGQFLI